MANFIVCIIVTIISDFFFLFLFLLQATTGRSVFSPFVGQLKRLRERVRPLNSLPIRLESPLVVESLTTITRPDRLQLLGEENPRQSRNNRIRRPLNNQTPTTHRIPSVQEGNPNLDPILVDDPTALPPNRPLRFRTSTAPVTTTSRVRQPALRPRPTTAAATNRFRPSVRITWSKIIRPTPSGRRTE